MKTLLLIFFSILIFSNQAFSQVTGAADSLTAQVSKMGEAFLKQDYDGFIKYTYPTVVKSMGGPKKMVSLLHESIEKMKADGFTFHKISFDKPAAFIRYGKELQSVVIQHIEMKHRNGRIENASALLAISTDNGLNWTFIDTSGKPLETLRKMLPNLSPDLKLPPKQTPIMYNEER